MSKWKQKINLWEERKTKRTHCHSVLFTTWSDYQIKAIMWVHSEPRHKRFPPDTSAWGVCAGYHISRVTPSLCESLCVCVPSSHTQKNPQIIFSDIRGQLTSSLRSLSTEEWWECVRARHAALSLHVLLNHRSWPVRCEREEHVCWLVGAVGQSDSQFYGWKDWNEGKWVSGGRVAEGAWG